MMVHNNDLLSIWFETPEKDSIYQKQLHTKEIYRHAAIEAATNQ